jgi:uncharacterized protein (TIGR00725 family)
MTNKQKLIAVIGGSQCSAEDYALGEEVGRLLAERGMTVICGGLSGIMESVCKGAVQAGGVTIGILPGDDPGEANQFVTIPIATGMGIGRNIVIVRSAGVCIAIDGRYGTLSEIAYALQLQKSVITLNSWNQIHGTIKASTAQEAVQLAVSEFKKNAF